MKRMMIAMLLLACIFAAQGVIMAQTASTTQSCSWMSDGCSEDPNSVPESPE